MTHEGAALERVRERMLAGRHTAVLGRGRLDPLPAPGVLKVDCDLSGPPLGPLLEARWQAEQLLDERAPMPLGARIRSGLRQRLLGEQPEPGGDSMVVAALNRLARLSSGPVGLVLQSVDSADRRTLQRLEALVRRPGWLKAPLVLAFESLEPEGAAKSLLDAVREVGGEGAIVSVGAEDLLEPEAEDVMMALAPDALDPEVLHVLRAGALIGNVFEAELAAALLAVDPLEVLELLQVAHDSGVAIDDRGDGRFVLADSTAEALRRSLLPSLAGAWHRRLAELLGEATPRGTQPQQSAPEAAPPTERPVARAAPAREPSALEHLRVGDNPLAAAESEARRLGGRPDRQARAGRHAEAAGQIELAAEQYLAAAERSENLGAYDQALDFAERALGLVASLPSSPGRRQLRIRALGELGRMKWHAAGPGEIFSLDVALEQLDNAQKLLAPGDPVELRAEIGSLIASVCYDIGGRAALERALEELTQAGHALLEAGRPVEAARLLNDEAAVWVRLGDPVRANHLLSKSREVFGRFATESTVAQLELAETDHLVARLMLHAPPRPGKERESLELGIQHALAAEETYRGLGRSRELARVWETLGRLERLSGKSERSSSHLVAAIEAEQQIGDAIGLARSTAALSDLLSDVGQPERALELLRDSITLNFEKGSPVGLAFNRRALAGLAARAGGHPLADGLEHDIERLRSQLELAERAVGHVEAPIERDDRPTAGLKGVHP
jgi:tetratricopeptide (TPR) repeat protein